MRVVPRTVVAAVVTPAVVLLAVAACASGPDAAPTASSGSTRADDAAGSAGPDTVTTGVACLVGTWEATPETAAAEAEAAFRAGFGLAVSEPVTDLAFDYSGTTTIVISEDAWRTEHGDLTNTATLTQDGHVIVITTVLDGAMTAGWDATSSSVTLSGIDVSGLTVSSSTTLDGVAVEAPASTAEATGVVDGQEHAYVCSGDELRLAPLAGGPEVVQTLRRVR